MSNILGQAVKSTLKEIHIDMEENVECPFSAELLLSPKCSVTISPALSFILFVNGRYIQNTRIKQGIRRILEQYYYCSDTNSKSRNQNTFCYVSIIIDAHLIDVNVHPNKREICFLDEDYVVNRIVSKVEEAIEKLVNTQSIGSAQLPRKSLKSSPSPSKNDESIVYANKKVRVDYAQRKIQFTPSLSKINSSSDKDQSSIISLDESQQEDNHDSSSPQSVLTDNVSVTPLKETRDDLQLLSVEELREEIRRLGRVCGNNSSVFSKSVFISCLENASLGLIQYENELYVLNLSGLL